MSLSLRDVDDLCRSTVGSLSEAFAAGEVSPVEAAEAALARAEACDEQLNAFTQIDREGALEAARRSEERWRRKAPCSPIDGIPTTVKDIVYCSGLDVRFGSNATDASAQQPDAPAVRRLKGAGAVILGLTATPEFGWKPVTDSPRNGITRNPWDSAKTPGGSSGGAAAAAASGAGLLHLGTDAGGSIRIPAAFTGIVGHKPSYGFVPAYPPSAFGTLAHIGPMARCVEDVALMLNAMSGKDPLDWNQPLQPLGPAEPRPIDWAGLRIGYWSKPGIGVVDAEVSQAVETTLADLTAAGAVVEETELPDQERLPEIFRRHYQVGAANRLSNIDPARHSELDPGFIEIASKGSAYTAVEHLQAQLDRGRFGAQMDRFLETYDLLVSPSVAIAPFEVGREVPPGSGLGSWLEWIAFSFPINLSQQPACSLPCGTTRAGLPIGMQIVGPRTQDSLVLSAALTVQRMYPERFLSERGVWPFPRG